MSEAFSTDDEPRMYKCINKECKAELSLADLENVQGVKCPFCGGRVLIKLRAQDGKRVSCE